MNVSIEQDIGIKNQEQKIHNNHAVDTYTKELY